MSEKLSCYILTQNSERHLADVISPIVSIVDDLVMIDSGSSDSTEKIARQFGARFIYHQFIDFRDQRQFAQQQCHYRWVLTLDSDEIPDANLVRSLVELKKNDFAANNKTNAYKTRRRWLVMGREVHAFYPIVSPDFPIRLVNKDHVGYIEGGRRVHETAAGFESVGLLDGSIHHYSCRSKAELWSKLDFYSTLAAEDLRELGKQAGRLAPYSHALAAWIKWYLIRGGWKDGKVGWLLGKYAFQYTCQKYKKLRNLITGS